MGPFTGGSYFSFCNQVGGTWQDIYRVLHNNWRFVHKGFLYVLDLSQLMGLGVGPDGYNFSLTNASVLTVIEQFASAMCRRIRLEVYSAGSPGSIGGRHTIKVIADNIAAQPPPALLMNQPSGTGNIRARLNAGGGWKLLSVRSISNCVFGGGINDILQSQKYGLESAEEISDALIVGDNLKVLYEVMNTDETKDECSQGALCPDMAPNANGILGSGNEPIRHYWGEQADSRGNMVPIVSENCGDDELFYVDVSAQVFFRTIQPTVAGFPPCLTNSRYLPITVLEIRAAGNSFESWFQYMCEYKMHCLLQFFSPSGANTDFGRFDLNVIFDILQVPAEERGYSPDDAIRTQEDVAAVSEQMHSCLLYTSPSPRD